MAKAIKKEVKKNEDKGFKAKDLSPEKRSELFNAELEKFLQENSEIFGISIGAEIVWTPRAAVPRIVLVDLLKTNTNANQAPVEAKKQ